MTFDIFLNTLIKDLSQAHYVPCTYASSYQNFSNHYEIFEEDNNIIFKCLAAGLSQKDIDITFDKKKLNIETSNKESDKNFASSIKKSITLKKSIDVNNSFASLKEGILTITMPIDVTDSKQKIYFK